MLKLKNLNFIFASLKLWRDSSVGQSVGFITRRSGVQVSPSLLFMKSNYTIDLLFLIFSISIYSCSSGDDIDETLGN